MGPSAIIERLAPVDDDDGDGARRRARDWLDVHGLPGARDEAWRYTPVDEILSRLTTAGRARPAGVTRRDVDRLAGQHGGVRLVLVNGVYAPDLSDTGTDAEGLWCGTRADTTVDGPEAGGTYDDGFQALNRAAGGDPVVVVVARGIDLDRPIHLVHLAAPDDRAGIAHPRAVVTVGEASRVHVIESFVGFAGPAITNSSTTIDIGEQAQVSQHRVQNEAFGATHIGHTQVTMASGSRYVATSLMFGGDIARHTLDVTLRGRGAEAELSGLYRPVGHQRFDTSVRVDHAASHGTSTQRFKGVVADHATGAFSGRIVVRPGTVATDAHQTNQNLVLAPTAQAESRPWLEIFADDVRCTHGSTVGRLDDDALFYLRSRGIPLEEGRALLIDAFTREITDAIEPRSLRAHIAAIVRTESREHQP